MKTGEARSVLSARQDGNNSNSINAPPRNTPTANPNKHPSSTTAHVAEGRHVLLRHPQQLVWVVAAVCIGQVAVGLDVRAVQHAAHLLAGEAG